MTPPDPEHRHDLDHLTRMAAQVADIYAARFDVPKDADWAAMKLAEEQGELMGAWLAATSRSRHSGLNAPETLHQDLADEAADVLGFLLVFCDREGVDLGAAFTRKWGRYLPQEAP